LFACPLKQVLAQFSELDSQCTLISQLDRAICVCEVLTPFVVCHMSETATAELPEEKKNDANVFHMPNLVCCCHSKSTFKLFVFSNPVYAFKLSHINPFNSKMKSSMLL